MAIAFVAATAKGAGGAGNTTTTAIDTTGATLIVVTSVKYTGTGGTTDANPTLSDSKGNTWTPLTSATSSVTADRIMAWYCIPTSVGASHTFTTTVAGACYNNVVVHAFSGTKASSVLDIQQQTNDTSASTSQTPGSLTPSEDNCVVVQIIGSDGSDATAIGSSYNLGATYVGWAGGNQVAANMAYKIQTTATATAPTWTLSPSGGAGMISVSFKSAAVAASQNSNYLMRRR